MKQKIKHELIAVIICLLLLLATQIVRSPVRVQAGRRVTGLEQMEQVLQKQISKGKRKLTFTASEVYTTAQIRGALSRAAMSQDRLLAGRIQFGRRTGTGNSYAEYTIVLSADALMKIKRLDSEADAVKAAAKALKNSKYKINFYSETSYYEIFSRLLQEHPEYNYGTVVWKNTNGAYGYHRSSSLTKKQQDKKMKAADRAAARAVEQCVTAGMTDRQKARAVHDYLIRHCAYGGSQNAYTAYGALVDGAAVCQGYAAAFNLMAQKCGLLSMTVCGRTRGGDHAWNYIKIGKNYYYLDCTWDDTGDVGTGIVYIYFLVGADKMRVDHVWDEAGFPPEDIRYMKYLR